MKITKALALAGLLLSLSACGAKTLYDWNGYNYALLKHYKDATSPDELSTALGKIVSKIEKKNGNIPPGLYADYAFALYEAGNVDEALIFFNKEKEKWPEAAPFMDNVISRITSD